MNKEAAARVLEKLLPSYYRVLRNEKAEFYKSFSLTPAQIEVLFALKMESMNLSTLSEITLLDSSTLVGIVDRLEKQGMIKKKVSPRDRRKNILTLSDKGKSLMARVPVFNSRALDIALENLDSREREAFVGSLEKILQGLKLTHLIPSPPPPVRKNNTRQALVL